MNGLPYYKRYPRDFIEGTIGLGFELKTAYAFILDLIYVQGGKLPDEPRYISGLLECSVRKWKSIRQALIDAGKITVAEGSISNYRAVSELESYAKVQDKQRENRSRPNKINDLPTPKPDHTEPDTDTEKEKRRARERALRSEFEDFWKGWPNKVGKPKALTAFIGKRKSHSLQAIIAGRDRYVRTKPPDRPWLNPATFLNQERFNDQPAETGKPAATGVELPKWEGPESDRQQDSEPEDSGVLRGGSLLHFPEKGGGQRPLLCDQSGVHADRVDEVADLLSADARSSPGNVLSA